MGERTQQSVARLHLHGIALCVCMCVYVCVFACVCMCMYKQDLGSL
jgi:hypothetical protein